MYAELVVLEAVLSRKGTEAFLDAFAFSPLFASPASRSRTVRGRILSRLRGGFGKQHVCVRMRPLGLTPASTGRVTVHRTTEGSSSSFPPGSVWVVEETPHGLVLLSRPIAPTWFGGVTEDHGGNGGPQRYAA